MNDLFPLNEYRGHEAKQSSVRSITPSAKAVVIDTQFDASTADTLASAILNATKNVGQAYTFAIDGIIDPDDMKGAMKLVTITFGSLVNYTAKITAIKVDWAKQQTVLTVRGVA